MSAQLAPIEPTNTATGLTTTTGWELAQRVAKGLAASTLVPQEYRGNVPNCIIALEMANRMGASPLMVMQNLYLVHGRPGWSSQFLIATFNQCGRFSAMRFEWEGQSGKDEWRCRAWAIEKESGEKIFGSWISMKLAKDEGWYSKSGSKWKTMPEQMMMYRAASFLVRAYAPELSMGLQTQDELQDIPPPPLVSVTEAARNPGTIAAIERELSGGALNDEPPQVAAIAQELHDAISNAVDVDALNTLAPRIDELPEELRGDLFDLIEVRKDELSLP